MTFYTAFVQYRVRNEAGELEDREAVQDVTDDLAEGADREALVDNLFYKQVEGCAGFFDITGGGIREE